MREQDPVFNTIIDHSDALIFAVDRRYRYTCFNRQHAAMMQALYDVRIDLGCSLLEAMTVEADRDTARRNLDRALAGETFAEEAHSGEELRIRKYFRVTHVPICAEDGSVIGVAVLAQDMSERRQFERERQGHLVFLESLDKVNRAIQGATTVEQMMSDVLDKVLEIFDCDRAFMLYPCDPEAAVWAIPMGRAKPEYPWGEALKVEFPREEEAAGSLRLMLDVPGALKFGRGLDYHLPATIADRFGVKSCMLTALRPKIDKPWVFGLHQCSHARIWSTEEERLFLEIGRRLADGLNALLAQRNLQLSEKKYRRIVDTSHEGIWMLDAAGRTGFVNARLAEMLGYPEEELLGRLPVDFVPAEDVPAHQQRMQNRARGKGEDFECRLVRKNGEILWALASAVPFSEENQAYSGAIAMFTDITERKKAEGQILRSEQRLRLHREQSPLGFLEWDENFRAVEWNAACERIFGYTRDEAIGRHARDLILPEAVHGLVGDIYQDLMNQRGGQHSINENVTKDGRTIICEWFNTTLIDKDGKAIGVASVCNDITEQRRMEEALNAKREQLATMTEELSLAEERERLRIASVLHDHIGQLLLLGRIKLGSLAGCEMPEAVRKIIDETSKLIDQATQDAHSLTVQLNPPILAVTGLEAALEWLGRQMRGDYGLEVDFRADQNLKPLSDELASVMYQCARELLINVARHARTDRARLEVSRNGEMYQLEVSDRGVGFDPALIAQSAVEDCHFGLFSIQLRVERVGGSVRIHSAPGEGSRIQIQLPLARRKTA